MCPPLIREMIFNYYERLWAMVVTKGWNTNLFPYDIGLFQGCVLSTILFDMVFNLLLDFLKPMDKFGYKMKPPAEVQCLRKAYADDLTLITDRVPKAQEVLDKMTLWLNWSQTMKAKPKKCRALAAKLFQSAEQRTEWSPHSGKAFSTFDPLLTIAGQPVQAIGPQEVEPEDSFKFLGRVIAYDLKEKKQELAIQQKFVHRMDVIDKDLVNGMMKLWLYQFSILPFLSWPFQIYDFPLSFAKELEQRATRHLKRWGGIYRNADVDILYRPREKFGLQVTSITAHYKAMQVIKCHLLKHTKEGDSGVIQKHYLLRLEDEKKFTRRWKPTPVLEEAEAKVVFDQKFAGQTGKQGLGLSDRYKRNLSLSEQRERAVEAVVQEHKQEAEIHTMGLALQGGVLKWGEDVQPYNLSWNTLITTRFPKLISHILNSYINCLPTPNMLKLWKYTDDASCPLCRAPKCTLMHILSMKPSLILN